MKKLNVALFCIIVSLALVVILARDAFSAIGDVVAWVKTPEVTLSTAQKTKLLACVQAAKPDVVIAEVQYFGIMRQYDETTKELSATDIKWRIHYKRVMTDAEAVEAEISGGPLRSVVEDATHTAIIVQTDWAAMDANTKSKCGTFAVDAFNPVAITDLVVAECIRDGSSVKCSSAYEDTFSVATYKTLKHQANTPILKAVKRVK